MSYFQKLFSDRLFVVELAAANAVVYRLSVFIAVEWLRKLATENPLVVRHLFEDPCVDFTIKGSFSMTILFILKLMVNVAQG